MRIAILVEMVYRSGHSIGNNLEASFADLAEHAGFRVASAKSALHDFEHHSGKTILAFKPAALGARDLRANMLQLALALSEHPGPGNRGRRRGLNSRRAGSGAGRSSSAAALYSPGSKRDVAGAKPLLKCP